MNRIDRFLNSITMYRLLLAGLTVMALWAVGASLFGALPFSPFELVMSAVLLIITSKVTNALLAQLFGAVRNVESADITALILFFIFAPPATVQEGFGLVLSAGVAMAVKYVVVSKRMHIVNPAAFAAVMVGMVTGTALWWVATPVMLPMTLIVGLAVVRKIRRFDLFLPFFLTSVTAITFVTYSQLGQPANLESLGRVFWIAIASWPVVFLGTVMLTEPITTPPRRWQRIAYGGLVGVLLALPLQSGAFAMTPELALVLGNLVVFAMSPNLRLELALKARRRLAADIYEFLFDRPPNFSFQPGQYMEWTVSHESHDLRGNRRYFTIASSPTESTLNLALKADPETSSSFKKALLAAKPGQLVIASRLSGDFVLPDEPTKLVCIAGGIGVTPFRSMVQYWIDTRATVDAVLFYTASHPDEFVYRDLLSRAEVVGLRTHYVVTDPANVPQSWPGLSGFLTSDAIEKAVPDFAERIFYLSGPNVMVDSYKNLLRSMALPAHQIRTDYFPGY